MPLRQESPCRGELRWPAGDEEQVSGRERQARVWRRQILPLPCEAEHEGAGARAQLQIHQSAADGMGSRLERQPLHAELRHPSHDALAHRLVLSRSTPSCGTPVTTRSPTGWPSGLSSAA